MEQETVWIIAIVALAVGVLIGFLMGKSGSSEAQRKTLEAELNGSRAEMDRYKKEVTSHFEQTATLVNELTEQYRKVHQHLATGAQALCPDQAAGRSLQSSLQPKLEKVTSEESPDSTPGDLSQENQSESQKHETAESGQPVEKTNEVKPPEPEPEPEPDPELNIEPPKDWAPKKPDDEGTLSDRYGLKKNAEEAPKPPQPDPGLHEEENDKNETEKKAKD